MKIFKILFSILSLPITFVAEARVDALNHAGFVVSDLEAAVAQWQSGTGDEFGTIRSKTYKVKFAKGKKQDITIRNTFTKLNNPFLTLEQASPAIGPWAPAENNGKAPGYLGYAVFDVKSAGRALKQAGMKPVAKGGSQFAFYKGINGVLIKLVRCDLVPTTGEVNHPQADIVFGPVDHPNIAVYDYEAAKIQLANALSFSWNEPGFTFPGIPYIYAGIGIVATDLRFTPSDTLPTIYIGDGRPHLGPYAASPTTSGFRVVYNAPAGSVPLYRDQLLSAGFALNASVEIPPGNLINAIFTAPQGYWIEVQQPL